MIFDVKEFVTETVIFLPYMFFFLGVFTVFFCRIIETLFLPERAGAG